MLSKGRLRLGMGRGLARREFAAFRLSMDESRGRFDEAAPMIVNALKTGFIEGDGQVLQAAADRDPAAPEPQLRRPHLRGGLADDSVVSAAKLGAHMVMFADRPWQMRMPAIEKHRELRPQDPRHRGAAPPC